MNEHESSHGVPGQVQRWTAKRKAAVVLELIKGTTTAAEVARQHDLTIGEVEQWRDEFLAAGEDRMRRNPKEAEAQFEAERKELHAKIGELTLERDAAKKQFAAVRKGSTDETS